MIYDLSKAKGYAAIRRAAEERKGYGDIVE